MRRRDFFAAAGGAAIGWPLAAQAQRSAKIPRLGVLLFSTPQTDPQFESFRRAFDDLKYVDGQNVVFDHRSAEGRPERLPGLAADLVGAKPDVLLAIGGDVAPFAGKATQTIPIVFVMSVDPVQTGMVASLSRPGGNATGVTFLQDELASKRLELLKEAAPSISRVAFLFNPDHVDNEPQVAARAAEKLGLRLHSMPIRTPNELPAALQAIKQAGADALYAVSSRQTVSNIPRIVEFATENRLPLAGGWGAWAQGGGLLSYGPNVGDVVRQAAGYVDKIFKGTKPADLPVQQPTRFELLINLKSAKALGLTIPEAFLLRADRVIE
jgi:putative ABC transport system substrate-binding protein